MGIIQRVLKRTRIALFVVRAASKSANFWGHRHPVLILCRANPPWCNKYESHVSYNTKTSSACRWPPFGATSCRRPKSLGATGPRCGRGPRQSQQLGGLTPMGLGGAKKVTGTVEGGFLGVPGRWGVPGSLFLVVYFNLWDVRE